MNAFEVIVRSIGGDSGGQRIGFELTPGKEVAIGRSPDLDVTIPDPQVSGRHALLRCTSEGELRAFDLGSLNGTLLEGEPVASTGSPLDFGSILRIGDHTLEIANPAAFETLRSGDVESAKQHLISLLEDAYGGSTESGDGATCLREAIEQATAGLSLREREAVLSSALADAAGSGSAGPKPPVGQRAAAPPVANGSAERSYESAPAAGLATADRSASTPGGAAAALRDLASQLVPNQPLESDEDVEVFCRLLEKLTVSMLGWLAKGLQSRGIFAEEFGAEVTLVFQRSNNPLKAMALEDLTNYLLDWRHETPVEQRSRYLEGVLKDMSEHQLGMIAGVKEAITGLLGQLAPERIEQLAQTAKGWSKASKVWSTYQQTHKELVEEQNKLFAEMVTPAIQKGYLHQHGGQAEN